MGTLYLFLVVVVVVVVVAAAAAAYPCYHLHPGYLQSHTCNKPCLYGIQCCSYSVLNISATFVVISPVKYVLYFHSSTSCSMCAVPNTAVFCGSSISCFPGMLLRHCPIIIIIIIIIITAAAQTGPAAYPPSYKMGTASFPGVKQPGRHVDNPPNLVQRLKKEWSYTSTPPLGLRDLF